MWTIQSAKDFCKLFVIRHFTCLYPCKNQKNFQNALTTLKNGIDFVIVDEMEVDFYTEIAKAFKGLGNSKQEKKFKQKAKNLKN